MKRYIVYLLAVGMALTLLISALSDGAVHARSQRPSTASQSDPSTPTFEIDSIPPVIDFDTVAAVPQEFRQPIQDAITKDRSLLPAIDRLIVTALRSSGDWMEAILVPAYVVEAGWEIDLKSNEIVEVLGQRDAITNTVFAYVRGSPGFSSLARKAPKGFIDFSTPSNISPAAVDFLFPWTSGQSWYKTQGWHQGNAIDFQPVVRTTPAIHFAVLAAASGRLTRICGGAGTNDTWQSILRVEHTDGSATQYFHLDASSIRTSLLGQNIVRGQFIGLLYNGTQGGGGSYQFNTPCGYGSAVHLHFVLPQQNVTIDGRNANDVANSGFASQYGSSNTRVDDGGSSPNCADGEGVVLYEQSNYGGRCTRFTSDDTNLSDNPIGNDAASSVRVIGNYEAVVYEHDNYNGASSTFTGDDPDFGNDAIGHDHATSIRVRRRDAGGTSNCDGGQGVYLYENSNQGGRCTKLTGDAPNPTGWYVGNDAASSIRIIGSYEATLYEHSDYNGASTTFIGDDPDLSNDAIGNDRASSIRVRQRDAGGTSNCDGGQGAYLYEHPNYTGRCSKFTTDTPNPTGWYVGNDSASSIRIIGNYEAIVYEHDNYNGASSTFTGDDPDFGDDSIGHDRVSSLRLRQRSTGPTSCADGQFLAEYFNGRDLSGNPIFRRCESSINVDWGYNGPGNGVGNDNYSIRWSGRVWFDEGLYRLITRTDDGVRLWLDDQLIIDQWHDMGATEYPYDRNLSAGIHNLRMEYYESGGAASARFSWQRQQNAVDPDDGRTIGYDTGLDGTVNPANERDDYYFEGSANQAITIRMDKRDSNLDSYVELYNPDGTLLGQDDDNGGNQNSRLAITLRQNGRHKIIARGYTTSVGGYRLSLSRESTADPDDSRWISFGGTLQGMISPNGDRDWYYFSGTAGRVISVRMNMIDSGLDSYLELYNSGGIKVAENDDGGGNRNAWLIYSLPTDGVYRIMARSYQLSSSGRYNLALALANNTNLARGKPATATSTEFSGVEPSRAVDGSTSTRWSSRFSDPQLFQVDLGGIVTFDQVVLRWESAYARRYGIYYWTGTEWRNVYWTDTGDGGNDTITFAPVQARFVAMYGVQRGTAYGYSLWEFEVYNTTAVLIPLVPPDPGDKPPEGGVEPLAPLAPNDPDKLTILIGDGNTGQENVPLGGSADVVPSEAARSGIPSANILYPLRNAIPIAASDMVLFQGEAVDNDEDGASIVAYEWRLDSTTVLSTQPLFTLNGSTLSPGEHIVSFRAQDNEGNWSDSEHVTIQVGFKVMLPFARR